MIPAAGCEAWQPTGRAPSNAFTVDLEEWFHICGAGDALSPDQWDRLPARIQQTTRTLLDLLDHAQVRATFFVVGWIAERYPRLVEEVKLAGHEIGSHGYLHRRLFDGVSEKRFSLNRLYDRANETGRLHAIVHDGEWYHVGTPEGLAATRARLASHRIER